MQHTPAQHLLTVFPGDRLLSATICFLAWPHPSLVEAGRVLPGTAKRALFRIVASSCWSYSRAPHYPSYNPQSCLLFIVASAHTSTKPYLLPAYLLRRIVPTSTYVRILIHQKYHPPADRLPEGWVQDSSLCQASHAGCWQPQDSSSTT